MQSPITNDVFDSRDLIEYKEFLEGELVDLFNSYLEGHNQDAAEGEEAEEISDISEVDFNLEGFKELNGEEIEEYEEIKSFCNELEEYAPDFPHGESIIHENYFEDYARQLVEDCGYISKDFPSWIAIDWESTAEAVKQDYTGVDFQGSTYYIR